MKKKIVLLLTVLLLLSGCDAGYSRNSAKNSQYQEAIAIFEKAVALDCGVNLRLDTINLLETDHYGRKLFHYSVNTDGRYAILLICQKTDGQLAYYYEDICYFVYNRYETGYTEADKNELKERNDWGKPLDEGKLRPVNYTGEHINVENYTKTKEIISTELKDRFGDKNWASSHLWLNGLETDERGRQVILAVADFENDKTQAFYWIVYDHSRCSVAAAEENGSGCDFRESVIAFKDAFWRQP